MVSGLEVVPTTPERWDDLQTLFGPNGACAGCWCMYWRLKRSEFSAGQGEGNRHALHTVIESGSIPGLLGYLPDPKTGQPAPAAWVSLGPRDQFPTLDRSTILYPVDDTPVWSIVCFYIGRKFRRQGLMLELLKAAGAYAFRSGAATVEGYPVIPKAEKVAPLSVYTGVYDSFVQAGFYEVARRKPERPIMRLRAAG